jgi:Peptidase inhibitor family I36
MNRNSRTIIVGLLLMVSAACDDDSPTTPTGTAVVIYQDTNFRGDSRAVAANASDLDDLPGCGGPGADWDDCISSIRVPSGWEVTVFEHDLYSGASATFTTDIEDLERQMGPCGNDWDDCISSIQVRQR